MNDHWPPKSEGEQLNTVLDELQREHAVREISGWDTGFTNLNRALDGLLAGLYVLIGPPGCGKTSWAKQLLDQVALKNSVPAIFFTFAENKKALRIKTLARLSGLESREIRRGSAYLLHWYGVPRLGGSDASQLPASWDKLKRVAEEARTWLDRVYLFECGRETAFSDIEKCIQDVKNSQSSARVFVAIDDCQRLQPDPRLRPEGLGAIADKLQAVAMELNIPLLAVVPDSAFTSDPAGQVWSEKAPGADVIMVMGDAQPQTQIQSEPQQSITLHIVKNRGGETGKLVFEFAAPFSRFSEAAKS